MKEKLSKDFKKKWVNALTNGRYKQTSGMMYNNTTNGYCCLAVGCRVLGVGKKQFGSIGMPEDLNPKSFDKVKNELPNPKIMDELADMNDAYQMPFQVIAGFIHENL